MFSVHIYVSPVPRIHERVTESIIRAHGKVHPGVLFLPWRSRANNLTFIPFGYANEAIHNSNRLTYVYAANDVDQKAKSALLNLSVD